MTRLIRSGRIGGRVTETLRCATGRAIAAALAASFAVLAIGGVSSFAPIGSVFAQQAQSADLPEFSTYDLFTDEEDSVDLRPEVLQQLADAIRKAQAPGSCSLGRLKIRVPTGALQDALLSARRDAVLAALDRLGVPVAGRLFVETSVAGGPGGTDTVYEPALDKRPPKLDVIWTPEKGTPVEADRRITAKATASDDPTSWQTGLKNIKLTVEGGDRPFGFKEYPQDCEHSSPPRTLERFYIVPSPAPPMVRLRATARDYAGNETEVWADFPTGNLTGLWKYMDGSTVSIEHNIQTKSVTAKFVTPYACPSGYATIDRLFDGQLEGAKLSGKYWKSCNDKLLVDACGKDPTYVGDFNATVSQEEISGEYRLPYFTWSGACQGLKQSTISRK